MRTVIQLISPAKVVVMTACNSRAKLAWHSAIARCALAGASSAQAANRSGSDRQKGGNAWQRSRCEACDGSVGQALATRYMSRRASDRGPNERRAE